MPGRPPSASTSMPESSASTQPSECARPKSRLDPRVVVVRRAGLVRVVVAVERLDRPAGEQRLELARLVRVARAEDRVHGSGRRDGLGLERGDLADAGGREAEQLVERLARERVALGGRLHLDEAAVAGHDDVHVGVGARVLGVVEVEERDAVDDADRDGGDRVAERLREAERSSARRAATYAPQIAAQRVPPSAWRTSQSSQSVRSPSASKSATARIARPISRWISTVRPCCLPRDASRCTRSPVDAGRSEYSAVIQPLPWPRSQRGMSSSTMAVQSTFVRPCGDHDRAVRVLEVVRRRTRSRGAGRACVRPLCSCGGSFQASPRSRARRRAPAAGGSGGRARGTPPGRRS